MRQMIEAVKLVCEFVIKSQCPDSGKEQLKDFCTCGGDAKVKPFNFSRLKDLVGHNQYFRISARCAELDPGRTTRDSMDRGDYGLDIIFRAIIEELYPRES